ncbi:hypothetical protein EJ02DRAFT_472978 [Clathrospora elynae]|uniref:Uncharacterized protein n=1 Tax=Clathrospora elynae TaxID=706981 RepID=A0A6A5SJR6_9PLEO|nr:hypothetical protein EJ02DRAFT_472978 [Clathrospora elynae]
MSPSSLNVRSQLAADAGIVSTFKANLLSNGYGRACNCQYCSGLSDNTCCLSVALPHCKKSAVVTCKPPFAVVRAVALGIVVVGDLPQGLKVVFKVRVENSSGIIDGCVIKLCVV